MVTMCSQSKLVLLYDFILLNHVLSNHVLIVFLCKKHESSLALQKQRVSLFSSESVIEQHSAASFSKVNILWISNRKRKKSPMDKVSSVSFNFFVTV